MNLRYIASLAVGASLTLVVGLLVRNRVILAKPATATAAPSEAAALQQLSQEGQLRRLSSFLSERVTTVAMLVEYVPSAKATGLRWRGRDSLVTTLASRPVVMLRVPGGDTTRTPSVATSDSMRGGWALVVARGRNGSIISATGVVGGRLAAQCAGHDVSEYLLGVPTPEAFAGAGVFDLDGRVIGMVVRCGDRLAAIPMSELAAMMVDRDSLGRRVRERYGFDARPLDDAARRYARTDSGLFITAVRRGSSADRAGWTPGDVIRAIDGVSLGTDETVQRFDSLAADSHTVVVRHDGATRTTRLLLPPSDSGAIRDGTGTGIQLAQSTVRAGIAIGAVQAGSLAQSAGMRAGDLLLRVDNVAVNSAATAQRRLDRMRLSDEPMLIVFERDSVVRGALLRR